MTGLVIILAVFLAIAIGLWLWADADHDRERQAHDQTSKDYLACAQLLLRSEQENAAMADEIARLRRERLTVVRPAVNVADRIRAAKEAGRWDDQWRAFNEDGA